MSPVAIDSSAMWAWDAAAQTCCDLLSGSAYSVFLFYPPGDPPELFLVWFFLRTATANWQVSELTIAPRVLISHLLTQNPSRSVIVASAGRTGGCCCG